MELNYPGSKFTLVVASATGVYAPGKARLRCPNLCSDEVSIQTTNRRVRDWMSFLAFTNFAISLLMNWNGTTVFD
jgi:hypothetical protein